jgi:hypothetical protein
VQKIYVNKFYFQLLSQQISLTHIYRRLLQNVSTISSRHLQRDLIYEGHPEQSTEYRVSVRSVHSWMIFRTYHSTSSKWISSYLLIRNIRSQIFLGQFFVYLAFHGPKCDYVLIFCSQPRLKVKLHRPNPYMNVVKHFKSNNTVNEKFNSKTDCLLLSSKTRLSAIVSVNCQ